MRDKRFVAEHRSELLTIDQHKKLILWACKCVENVLPLITNKFDDRLTNAIKIAKEWTKDNVSVGDARKLFVTSAQNSILIYKPELYQFLIAYLKKKLALICQRQIEF